MAPHIVKSKAVDFDPSEFVDHYEEAVIDLLKKKQDGVVVPGERAVPQPQNVINIIDALRQSIAQEEAASALPKKHDGQGEILLPITGKKSKGTVSRPTDRPNTRQKKFG